MTSIYMSAIVLHMPAILRAAILLLVATCLAVAAAATLT